MLRFHRSERPEVRRSRSSARAELHQHKFCVDSNWGNFYFFVNVMLSLKKLIVACTFVKTMMVWLMASEPEERWFKPRLTALTRMFRIHMLNYIWWLTRYITIHYKNIIISWDKIIRTLIALAPNLAKLVLWVENG